MRTAGAGTVQRLRRANKARILRALHRLGGSGTRLAVADLSDLSPATVSLLLGELLDQGVLVIGRRQPSRGGRPREELRFNRHFGMLVGIDVAETYVHARAFDLSLSTLGEWRSNTPPQMEGQALVRVCAEAVRHVLGRTPQIPLLGVGVSVPGHVDQAAGVALASPGRRREDLALGRSLAALLDLAVVHVDNPLRASVMSELWLGVGRETGDLAVLTLGTGVGAGFAIDGLVRRGAHQLAGEWGHVPVRGGDRTCSCGRISCLETYLGAPGIVRTMAETGTSADLPRESEQAAAIDQLAARFDDSDPLAVETINRVAAALADGLVVLTHVVDPAIIIASGWVADRLGQRLLAPAEQAARERLLRPPGKGWLRRSTLGDEQVSAGVAALALEDLLEQLASRR